MRFFESGLERSVWRGVFARMVDFWTNCPLPPLFVSVPGTALQASYGERKAKAARANSSW